jgi:hypothetical protein
MKEAQQEGLALCRTEQLIRGLSRDQAVVTQDLQQFRSFDHGPVGDIELMPKLGPGTTGIALRNVELDGERGSLQLSDHRGGRRRPMTNADLNNAVHHGPSRCHASSDL